MPGQDTEQRTEQEACDAKAQVAAAACRDGGLRVCHVIECGATGSLQMLLLMAEAQRSRGDRVLIVYAERPGAPADLRDCVHADVELARLAMSPYVLRGAHWCWRFAGLLRGWQPDVVHFHGSRAGFLGRLVAGRRPNLRAFHSPHCISLMHLNLSRTKHLLYRTLERLAHVACPAVYVACTEPERRVVAREIGAPARLLENAVEDRLQTFARSEDTHGPVRRVVTCARIADLKDPGLFAAVCRTVRETRPDVEFRWIGDGDASHRQTLERAGVVVTGWLPRDDALRTVSASCVYLSTSRWEGMPVSVIEAMALRVPVVCRRAEWSEAMLADGKTGRLFDDAQSASRALLSADARWRGTVAERAAQAARQRFSEARFASDLAHVYREAPTGG